MIKNKKARRTAKTLRQIKLRWLRQLQLGCVISTQRLLAIKHYVNYDNKQADLESIDYIKLFNNNNNNKSVNRISKQIKKCKLK